MPSATPPLPPALQRAIHHASQWLDGLDDRPVGAVTDLATLRARLGIPLPETGTDPARVIDDLVAMTEGGHLGNAGGRFFAWVMGGSLTSAAAADWLTTMWDPNAALYACAPAAGVVEEVTGEWIKELLDLPRDASFAFTSGCQLAHFTCLAAARHAVLHRTGWDVGVDGLSGAPQIRVLVNEESHGSITRAVRFLGVGTRHLQVLPADHDGRITPATMASALADQPGPTIVVLNAADLNIAAMDRFADLIPMAHAAGAWVHIDGAFGLIARVSRSRRSMLAGVEMADSWATDGHKWLNVPFDSGIAIVRDQQAHRSAMTVRASYITAEGQARDEIDWNPEWSRRARGFAIYAALRELGRAGLEALVDRNCAQCHALVMGIGGLDGAEVVWEPQLNQGLVRFLDQTPGATAEDHDRRTDAVIAGINATGEAFFSGTTWRGRRAMRVSVVNWRTTEQDVARAIAAARRAIG
ncbi:MAG: pyridoxal-dependent decarboxylase [Gemmatimonadales bacterium]